MRTKTEAKRQQILNVAKALFQEVGFEKASMAQIAARLGGSKATLYNYFDSKEAVFIEAMKGFSEAQEGNLGASSKEFPPIITQEKQAQVDALYKVLSDAEGDVHASLSKHCELLLQLITAKDSLDIQRMMIAEAGRSGVGKYFYECGPQRGLLRLAGYLDAVMDSGRLRKADAIIAASQLIGMVKWPVLEPALFGVGELPTKAVQLAIVENGVSAFLRAYSPES